MYTQGLSCADFQQIVRQLLDGQDLAEPLRKEVRYHREQCDGCCGAHNQMLQLLAVVGEATTPEEYEFKDQEGLWRRIHGAVVQSLTGTLASPGEGQPLFALSDQDLDEIFGRCMVRRTFQRLKTVRELGRLDQTKIDPETEPGNIASLERFLLTREELESLSTLLATPKQSDAVKVVMQSDGDALTRLHDYIGGNHGVTGSLVISADGTILSSRLPAGVDADSTAVWALAAYHNARAACNAFRYNDMQQLVSRSHLGGYTLLSQVMGLMIVTFVDGSEGDMLQVLKQIHKIS